MAEQQMKLSSGTSEDNLDIKTETKTESADECSNIEPSATVPIPNINYYIKIEPLTESTQQDIPFENISTTTLKIEPQLYLNHLVEVKIERIDDEDPIRIESKEPHEESCNKPVLELNFQHKEVKVNEESFMENGFSAYPDPLTDSAHDSSYIVPEPSSVMQMQVLQNASKYYNAPVTFKPIGLPPLTLPPLIEANIIQEGKAKAKDRNPVSLVKKPRKRKYSPSDLQCDQCDRSFTQMAHLIRHKITHTDEKSHPCDICDKKFRNSSNLNRHKLTHTGDRPYTCEECEKQFRSTSDLARHKRTHAGEKPYACNECEKRFRQPAHLSQHKQTIHSTDRPYACDECDKKFVTRNDLARHKLTHNRERPFACDTCDKMFRNEKDLANHKETHSKERPYACHVCTKRFRVLNALMMHYYTHSAEKPFPCGSCDKQFKSGSDLRRHSRIHTGELPFACDICDRKFAQTNNLHRHKKTHVPYTIATPMPDPVWEVVEPPVLNETGLATATGDTAADSEVII